MEDEDLMQKDYVLKFAVRVFAMADGEDKGGQATK